MSLDRARVREVVAAALAEDLARRGDVTTEALIDASASGTAHVVARASLVVAGIEVAHEVFRALDPEIEFTPLVADGAAVEPPAALARVRGRARALLAGERTALNFLMRMCGIASAARAAVEEVAGTGARILDTRKTAPGLRVLDKYAVAAGGADNHRLGLWDAVLIKDTHVALVGSVGRAVEAARAAGFAGPEITVEVRDLDELDQAIAAGAGRALLDNMPLDLLRRAVSRAGGGIALEASGGLRPGTLRAVAECGVGFLSLGWLTHSAPAADLALEMESPDASRG